MQERPKRKALDAGCAIGRSSFELAREFDEVIGIDISAQLVREAQRLKESGMLQYTIFEEGELERSYEISLKKFGLEHASKKVNFWQADACDLKPVFCGFDLVLAGNLIDQLYDPKRFLEAMHTRIVKGGLLILTSIYDWQEDITPRSAWLGGYKEYGRERRTLQGIVEVLGNNFNLLDTKDIPYVFQKSARKYEHSMAQMSIWERV
jgi:putative 4-mercaptohistidine N1-methyltranferase